ncbi:MAG TPA: TadE/TadG family type IV pilus assembly protein [Pirellulales bacterium]|nr:TadE/TadG family type IV pilus assembly protein [Pirellulales bacterium]
MSDGFRVLRFRVWNSRAAAPLKRLMLGFFARCVLAPIPVAASQAVVSRSVRDELGGSGLFDRPAPASLGRRARRPRRTGTATVEFAVVLPLLLVMLLGIIEMGRAMMVGEVTAAAARLGARAAVISGASNAQVASLVSAYLQAGGIKNATTVININGAAGADVSTASTGDAIQVTVQAPMNSNAWAVNSFFNSRRISGAATFVKE